LHAAKGLEFPVVFICGVEDGLVPFREREADLAEERRLFYVGMTRAEEELVLLRAKSRLRFGERVEAEASPFVAEIPSALLVRERVVPPRKREASEQLSLF
jgi:DNA helicase-2/ATP-dependent DNA helicase PcrA